MTVGDGNGDGNSNCDRNGDGDSINNNANADTVEDIPLGMSTFGLLVYGGTILLGTTSITYRNALA
jgi:hypothetical protein